MPTPQSKQYPSKVRPASYTLVYDGKNILDCMNTKWPICNKRKNDMILSGHDYQKFDIKPNY